MLSVKLLRYNILLLLIIAIVAIAFFSGCGVAPTITQNGSISGWFMVPDNFKKGIESWTYPLAGASVDTTDSKGKKHITTTDNDGYYTIFDIATGYNYIVTAEGTKKGNAIVLKDVVEEVKEGENYNAGTADAESTTIALVLENIMEDPEVEIENINVDDIKNCENFNEALSVVSNTINSGENVLTSSTVSASIEAVDVPNSIIEPLPPEKKAGIMGHLIDGILNTAIANGYVFVLGSNGDILDYTITLDAGAGPDSGFWQFGGLTFGETVTIVGFHPKYKFNMAMGDFDLDEQFKDIGRFETFCAINEDFIQGGAGVPIGVTSLILTICQNIAATALNNQAIALASYLLSEIGYYDEFEIIAGNIYNVSPLPEFFELGKEYSTDVFAQNTGEKETIFRIFTSHEVVDKEKNRNKATSGISFDPEFRFITLKPGKSGSRNFKFTLDTFKSDRIIKFSLNSYCDYTSDWELVGEEYKIPLSFNENYPPVISDLSAPTGVKASDGESRIWVRISWNSVSGASHYKVYRATSQNGAKTAVITWQADTVAYDYGDFSTDPYYYFVKAATDSSGSNASPYSDYDIGWFKEKDLVVPTIYDPGYSVDSGVPYTVSWSDESTNGASKYNIMESTPTSGKVYEGNGTSKEFVHDVDEDTTYYYKVRAYYENEGWSEYSDKVDIVIKADST
jgi:hypothetical protein